MAVRARPQLTMSALGVGSDSGHIPFLIESTDEDLVFAEGDPDDLAAKLLLLANNVQLRARCAQAGSACVRHRYTYPAIASELVQILTEARGISK